MYVLFLDLLERTDVQVLTLIVHPGPPGDAGPAAIDWAIMGDRGNDADAVTALAALQQPQDRALPVDQRQRSHWGITVLQADNTMDGGPVWAFDQFPLPDVAHVTKSELYQGQVTSATVRAVTVALCRISKAYSLLPDISHRASRAAVRVDPSWAAECVSYGVPFMGGPLHERPQIKPGQRRPDLTRHTAADVARIINCGDSQPGGTLKTAKSFIFAYDAHMHARAADLPLELITARGFKSFEEVPAGTALATRDGAVLFKTGDCGHGAECEHGCGVAVWFTHGRLPKSATSSALNAKVPMAEALVACGEGHRLDGVQEWALNDFAEIAGTWQQVFVRSVPEGDAIVQLVYWDFYNGAFSTTGCQLLLKALQWAAEPARGNVKVLALMGGQYFSNGVALNIIESAEHPGRETWANINAIDDVVEFISGDVASVPRSDFLAGTHSLTERGIVTVACLRGNAAAGGVAFAAACDVVVSAGSVVLNPAYRAMGLHGSEFHLYSYVQRCGRATATHLVKDMLPLSAIRARELGLVDVVLGDRDTPVATSEGLIVEYVRGIAGAPGLSLGSSQYPSAPWTKTHSTVDSSSFSLTDLMCENKRRRYEMPQHTPLVNYRHEELSQMLLDSFHPHRSQRYHTRRIKFVRKVKADGTPTRFVNHRIVVPDEEESPGFDDAPGWVRGEEWSWVGLQTPASMATSSSLLIDFAAPVAPLAPALKRSSSQGSSGSEPSHDIRTDYGSAVATPVVASYAESPASTVAYNNSPQAKQRAIPSAFRQPTPVAAPARSGNSTPRSPSAQQSLSHSTSDLDANLLSVDRDRKKRGSFLGRLAGAFRSRSDLRAPNPNPRRTASVKEVTEYPQYQRPTIPNEGDTESPCLFNVTGDLPPDARSTRPQVSSA